jgi:hypothetical protein
MRSSCHKNKTGSLKLPHLFSPHSSRTSSQPIWSCQSITKGNRKKRKKKKGNIQTPKNDAKRDHQTTKQKHIHLGIAKTLQMRSSCHEKTQDHKNLLIFSTLVALEHHLNQLGVVKSITRGKPVAPKKKKAPKLQSFMCKKKSTTSLTPSFLSFFLSFFLSPWAQQIHQPALPPLPFPSCPTTTPVPFLVQHNNQHTQKTRPKQQQQWEWRNLYNSINTCKKKLSFGFELWTCGQTRIAFARKGFWWWNLDLYDESLECFGWI